MNTVLGIDGGGSRTRAIAADTAGRIVGSAVGPSINPRHHDLTTVAARLADLTQRACDALNGTPAAAFLSLGGISTRTDAAAVEEVAREVHALRGAQVLVDNDARAALVGGLAGRPGMVLIAGTGSACLGVAADGRRYWCGGWEHLADDAGSAYWVAVEAIKAAVRIEDGRLPASALHGLVFGRWPMGEARALAELLSRPDMDRAAIATLAPDIIALSATDSLARAIVERAANELARLVAVTARHLFGGQPSEVIFTGGLARSGPPFTPLLISRIEATAPGVSVVEPDMPPAMGAIIEAARLAGWPAPPAFLQALRGQSVDLP